MTDVQETLKKQLHEITQPGFRSRLVDSGIARGIIWRNGVLPPEAPRFRKNLTEDLLDYGYGVLSLALTLRDINPTLEELESSFLLAGEAIEAAVFRGVPDNIERGHHCINASIAFHLGGYSARAYSILPNDQNRQNLSPTEKALYFLLRRDLYGMQDLILEWIFDENNQDASIARRLVDDPDFHEEDAIHLVIVTSFMKGLSLFNLAIATGDEAYALQSKEKLRLTAEAAKNLNSVNHWLTSLLSIYLVDDLWEASLHKRVPKLPEGGFHAEDWNKLRMEYIQRLRVGRRAVIELWPSQLDAAMRALDPTDDLVVALPTSAGKTRIAELCILRCLAVGQRAIYITPLRALSAQVEYDLAETFKPLGFSVSTLYDSAGSDGADNEILRTRDIVVSTPEKLDFALRNDPFIIDDIGLVILDEGHMIGPEEREVRYEALVQKLLIRRDSAVRRIVCLSALFPNPDSMQDLVSWIRQDEPGNPIHSLWRPTRQRFGIVEWTNNAARL